jgi:hypothetical protein
MAATVVTVVPATASVYASGLPADKVVTFTPGSAGAGDPYFPLDGNGGYDVGHYDLNVRYDPTTGVLDSVATIEANATQNLSSFDLDLLGLDVASITIDGQPADFVRDGQELIVTPTHGITNRSAFTAVVTYSGVPTTVVQPTLGDGGFLRTDDGAVVLGEPHSASTWFPVNDHPTDAAAYSFEVSVPTGIEAIANGVLSGTTTAGGWTTWSWVASDPMAPYLATLAIGEFDITSYRSNGISILDAIDTHLFTPPIVVDNGAQVAFSGAPAQSSYKRLSRVITVPDDGATLAFDVARDTEATWDFFFVEVHTVGLEDWTTLPAYDVDGVEITSPDTGYSCPFEHWDELHPFLAHYQTFRDDPVDDMDPVCDPIGTTGEWHAVTGLSDWTRWNVDLSGYAGSQVEVSLTYVSDEVVQAAGVAIDGVVVSTGEGTTSFEADDDPTDGWVVPGAPEGSPGNSSDWILAGQDLLPASAGSIAAETLAREPEILTFLADNFGPYPFDAAGGIVDNMPGVALETQTRPVYAHQYFYDPVRAASAVIHELSHQWFGNSVRLARWQEIWLNEGFAVYAQWLWAEHEGTGSPQDFFNMYTTQFPPDDDFWKLAIGDPGPDRLLDNAVYYRGALTLHALRQQVGDPAFFTTLRVWGRQRAGKTATTAQFIALAEKISGQQLDDLFDAWLYTAGYPLSSS